MMELEPITRQEKIIAGQDLTPITRTEMFLKQYGGGGGGGGVSADAVLYTQQTLTDAQKKQARENIDAASDFVVNVTVSPDETLMLDKTFMQIQEAVNAGKRVLAKVELESLVFLPLVAADEVSVAFAGTEDIATGETTFISVMVASDGAVSYGIARSLSLTPEGGLMQVTMLNDPAYPMEIATKKYVDDNKCILKSTTPGSTKKFKITVDDSGNISATEVT